VGEAEGCAHVSRVEEALGHLGQREERVALPLLVQAQQGERGAALVRLAHALERLEAATDVEQLQEPLALLGVGQQVAAAEDGLQVVAGQERSQAQEDEVALRALSAPAPSLRG